MSGVIAFQKGGKLFSAATIGHVLLRFSTARLMTETDRILNGTTAGGLIATARSVAIAQARLAQDLTSVHDTPGGERQSRDLLGLIAGGLGLFNMWEVHRLQSRTSKLNTRLSIALHQVEAIRRFQVLEQEAVTNSTRALWKEDRYLRLLMAWERLRAVLLAFSKIVGALGHHKLSPAILGLIDLPSVWEAFVAKIDPEFESGPRSYFQMMRCPLSFGMDGQTLWVALHVPIRRRHNNHFTLYQPRWLPMIKDGRLFQFRKTTSTALAVANDEDEYQYVDQPRPSGCIALGPDLYCVGTAVQLKKGHYGCLPALWEKNWKVVKETCPIIARPARSGAWMVDKNRVAVYAPRPLLFLIKCDKSPVSRARLVGYVLVWLREGCEAMSENLHLRTGLAGLPGQTTIIRTMNFADINEIITEDENGTAPVHWPLPVSSIKETVDRLDRESLEGPDILTIIALSLGGGAAVFLGGFLLYFYYRYRKAAQLVKMGAP